MIKDPQVLQEVRASWTGMLGLKERVQRLALGGFAQGARMMLPLADIAHNLPFLQACSTLNDCLAQLEAEGRFVSNQRTLGALVRESKTALPWSDYGAVLKAVTDRNSVAHDEPVLPRATCWAHITSIENELKAWGVI